ncbi:hypothetical protein Galf_1232 [Gallionella capsiferriformans ES-2]|uniref:Uncharacterized protein n=1 Tax=Gallionella capsiferriformans (strain ES-2) TaxID=395494 RepID=D9SFG3_GALCS|nr:hypothetical protein Galf_1232 [Gallionella capsiferriformans ES-2]
MSAVMYVNTPLTHGAWLNYVYFMNGTLMHIATFPLILGYSTPLDHIFYFAIIGISLFNSLFHKLWHHISRWVNIGLHKST